MSSCDGVKDLSWNSALHETSVTLDCMTSQILESGPTKISGRIKVPRCFCNDAGSKVFLTRVTYRVNHIFEVAFTWTDLRGLKVCRRREFPRQPKQRPNRHQVRGRRHQVGGRRSQGEGNSELFFKKTRKGKRSQLSLKARTELWRAFSKHGIVASTDATAVLSWRDPKVARLVIRQSKKVGIKVIRKKEKNRQFSPKSLVIISQALEQSRSFTWDIREWLIGRDKRERNWWCISRSARARTHAHTHARTRECKVWRSVNTSSYGRFTPVRRSKQWEGGEDLLFRGFYSLIC